MGSKVYIQDGLSSKKGRVTFITPISGSNSLNYIDESKEETDDFKFTLRDAKKVIWSTPTSVIDHTCTTMDEELAFVRDGMCYWKWTMNTAEDIVYNEDGILSNPDAFNFIWAANNHDFMTLQSNGILQLNSLQHDGPSLLPLMATANGDIMLGGVSDDSFKTDISVLNDALEKVCSLQPVSFRYSKRTEFYRDKLNYGMIAQHVKSIIPEITYTDPSGVLGYSEVSLIPFLVKSVQELKEENVSLRNAITELQTEISVVKEMVAAMWNFNLNS